MATIGYAGLPAPDGGDAPTTAAAIAALAAALDPHLVQHVADQADRTATLATAPVGTVAVAADGTTWAKTDASTDTWATLWEPEPAWRTLSLATGYGINQLTPQIKRKGRQVFTRGRINRTDGTNIVGTNGIQIASVPDDCKPAQISTCSAFYSLTGDPLIGAGRFEVWGDNETTPSAVVFFSQDGAQDGGAVGTPWVDISGSYFLD